MTAVMDVSCFLSGVRTQTRCAHVGLGGGGQLAPLHTPRDGPQRGAMRWRGSLSLPASRDARVCALSAAIARRDEGSAPRECSAPLLSCSTAQLAGQRVSGCFVRNIPRERPGRPSLCARQGSNEGGDRRALRASAGALMPCTDVRAIAFVVCKGVCFSVCVLILAMLFCVMFSLSACAHVCFCNSIRIGMRSCGDVCAVLLLLWSMSSRVRGALREGGCRL